DYPHVTAPKIIRSRKLLFELLDDLRTKDFPAEQITLGGFSQGCLMAIDVGLRYPYKLAGIIGISGWVFEIENLLQEIPPAAKQQRLLLTHGKFDQLIPFDKVREQARQLKNAGFDVEWCEFPKDHGIYGVDEINVIR